MGPNGNKVLHFYQSYCKYIAQIYTSKVYNVIYISGNTLDKRNTDFQEEEEPGRKKTIFFSPLSITALSRYLVISPLASWSQHACMQHVWSQIESSVCSLVSPNTTVSWSPQAGLEQGPGWAGRPSHSGEGCLGWGLAGSWTQWHRQETGGDTGDGLTQS